MIVHFLAPIEIRPELQSMVTEFLQLATHTPVVVEIPYPDEPMIRTLLVRNARRYFMVYTPQPVYFCEPTRGIYRIETPSGIFEASNLMRIWELAKDI